MAAQIGTTYWSLVKVLRKVRTTAAASPASVPRASAARNSARRTSTRRAMATTAAAMTSSPSESLSGSGIGDCSPPGSTRRLARTLEVAPQLAVEGPLGLALQLLVGHLALELQLRQVRGVGLFRPRRPVRLRLVGQHLAALLGPQVQLDRHLVERQVVAEE